MKFMQKLTNERFAKPAARIMEFLCYLVICYLVIGTVLSFIGRQTFTLHTKTGIFERAIYAEENHDPLSHSMTVNTIDGIPVWTYNEDGEQIDVTIPTRGITVNTGDDIHVWTNDNDQIDLTIQIGLFLIYAAEVFPAIFAVWFLGRVFSNIRKGQIFTEQNASYLLYFGLLQFFVAVCVPFIKLLICWLTSLVSGSRMSISTGQAMFNSLIPSIAFIVAAYIFHYGVHLQDEVDHTL